MVGNVPTFLVINSGVSPRIDRDRLPYASFVRAGAPIHVTLFVRARGSRPCRPIRRGCGNEFQIPLQKVVDS